MWKTQVWQTSLNIATKFQHYLYILLRMLFVLWNRIFKTFSRTIILKTKWEMLLLERVGIVWTSCREIFTSVNTKKLKAVLSYNHTERQAESQVAHQAARSHWNALWRSKMGPRSIPKRQPKHQNFKAAAWRLMLDARCGYALGSFRSLYRDIYVKTLLIEIKTLHFLNYK